MRTRAFGLAMLTLVCGLWQASVVNAENFYPVSNVSVVYPDNAGPLWPEQNLIQGPGVGFDANEPHDKLIDGAGGNWVTQACGFPCSYINSFGSPVISLDLGKDRLLDEISMWGYSTSNSNGLKDFSLRFASNADGANGFGTSISYNPTFTDMSIDNVMRQSFSFTQNVTARYVELTALANYFEEPGDGSNGEIPGGDRVGIGEIAFAAPDGIVIDPPPPPSVSFYPISAITSSTGDTDFFLVDNLIEGSGVGFVNADPFNRLSGLTWVTTACGFPCDYLDSFDPPELFVDLGKDVPLNEINLWGYAASNANGAKEVNLSFATQADGPTGYGTSVAYSPTFSDLPNDDVKRQVLPFDQTVTARYVRVTVTDNHFVSPGDGTGGETPGGDRIGLGELAFPIPSSSIPGDFDGNGSLDAADINALLGAVAAANNPASFDLTKDGAVNQADIVIWIEDLKNSWVGDANLDGEFNSRDFVDIFQAGKFETGQAANWGEGDWNGDGVFASGDFVAAFQGGGFELGPRTAVNAVPEPASLSLLFCGLLGLGCVLRSRKS